MDDELSGHLDRDLPRVRPASIRDVARVAGVSYQTVSRVLNDHPSVRATTKLRVQQAMEELRFRPSRAARMLSTKRSRTLGVLAAAVGSHFGPASTVAAAEHAARANGFYASVAHIASIESAELSAAIGHLMSQDVEGIVIVAQQSPALAMLETLRVAVPIVIAEGDPASAGPIPIAAIDQRLGVRMALRHLTDRGHRRILHVAGPPDWTEANMRLSAYTSELEAARLPAFPSIHGDWTSESGFRAGQRILERYRLGGRPADHAAEDQPITGIFCANDQMALGVIHALRTAGLDVPSDVSIVGFDDIPEAAHFWPPLTTIRQDFTELGTRCVRMLVADIERQRASAGPPAPGRERQTVAPELIERESVRDVF